MRWTELITRNWALKLAALILAILLWAMMQTTMPPQADAAGAGPDTASVAGRELEASGRP